MNSKVFRLLLNQLFNFFSLHLFIYELGWFKNNILLCQAILDKLNKVIHFVFVLYPYHIAESNLCSLNRDFTFLCQNFGFRKLK